MPSKKRTQSKSNSQQPRRGQIDPVTASRLRNDLARIRFSIAAINVGSIGALEAQRQLEIEQKSVVRGVIAAIKDGALPPMPTVFIDGELLPTWERIAQHLRASAQTIPDASEISDVQVPLLGTDRSLHLSPPERIGAWISHALAVVDALMHMVPEPDPLKERLATFRSLGEAGLTDWITVTDAARRLMSIRDNIALATAKVVVSREASKPFGKRPFLTNGKNGASRRIDLPSFSVWLLEQREKDIAKSDSWASGR